MSQYPSLEDTLGRETVADTNEQLKKRDAACVLMPQIIDFQQ